MFMVTILRKYCLICHGIWVTEKTKMKILHKAKLTLCVLASHHPSTPQHQDHMAELAPFHIREPVAEKLRERNVGSGNKMAEVVYFEYLIIDVIVHSINEIL